MNISFKEYRAQSTDVNNMDTWFTEWYHQRQRRNYRRLNLPPNADDRAYLIASLKEPSWHDIDITGLDIGI